MLPIETEVPMEEADAAPDPLKASNARLSRALAAAKDAAIRATRLQELTAALSQARTECEVADVLLGRGLGVVEGERGILARIEGRCLHVVRMRGYSADDAEPRARSLDDASPLTLAVKRGEPVWLQADDDRRGQGTTVAVPLRHCGEIVGALAMSFTKPTAFGVSDREFTLRLSQAVADALFRAHSFDVEHIARREAESRAKARADLLGIVAHDLRNPLNVIGMSGAMLADGDHVPPAERHRIVAAMHRSVQQMNRLIGDLLDTTRLQAGRLTLELSLLDARDVIRAVEEMCRPDAAARGIGLRVQVPAFPCKLRADEGRLLQAVGNLVGNAVKFTHPGGRVTVSLSVKAAEAVFAVADTGPGLTADQQAHLFDTFWQAHPGDRRGIGLGLTITKGIVEAHGGRIWVRSAPGAGSTFSFALPLRGDG